MLDFGTSQSTCSLFAAKGDCLERHVITVGVVSLLLSISPFIVPFRYAEHEPGQRQKPSTHKLEKTQLTQTHGQTDVDLFLYFIFERRLFPCIIYKHINASYRATGRKREGALLSFLLLLLFLRHAVYLFCCISSGRCRGRSEGQTAFRVSLDDRPCLFQSVIFKKKKEQVKGQAQNKMGLEIFFKKHLNITKVGKNLKSIFSKDATTRRDIGFAHIVTSTSKRFLFVYFYFNRRQK